MQILNHNIYRKVKKIFARLYGEDAEFREGQYEAIEATLLNKRTLVVQKTGWGKSLVYFICTRLFRDVGRGVTVVVSPLLVLMENQLEAALKLGLKCEVLNSTVKERRAAIIDSLVKNSLDLILITPETLLSETFLNRLKEINIGFFVIDEAHCISDWGHDFRLKYAQINRVIKLMPQTVPILATTATANNRVIEDLKTQLGDSAYISRGALMRKSLAVQILKIPAAVQRYAWILQNITKLSGSGIIYCLTRRDCAYLADFLQKTNVDVMSYYSREEAEEELNRKAEQLFKENRIKALVSTVKLGMGYDKGDIAFVIHFQQPSNIISYYQQIGRAGRNIPKAYTFLMCGQEDREIQDYFIDTAFPSREEAESVREYIYANNERGTTLGQITSEINCSPSRIEKALMFLENEGCIIKERSRYYVTLKNFTYNGERYAAITETRRREQAQMTEMINTKKCYGRFIANCLDDNTNENCGVCANCLGYEEFPAKAARKYLKAANEYIENLIIPIEPRKRWAATALTKQTTIPYQNETGICLSKYGDAGYGTLVKKGKYSVIKRFREELVGHSAKVLKEIVREKSINAVTCIPSLRSNIVQNFAMRLAKRLGIKFIPLLQKSKARAQKDMRSSSYQCENALKSFSVVEYAPMPENILLIDDIVDSGWTLTVCGYKLMEAGCKKVFPFALADSSEK